jgi:hypothetical protein
VAPHPSLPVLTELGFFDWHPIYSHLLTLVHRSRISYTLKMEAIRSSETSVTKISTRRHIQEDGIIDSDRRRNLKSYISYELLKNESVL